MNITQLPKGSLRIRVVPWGLWITSAALLGFWLLFMFVIGFATLRTALYFIEMGDRM
jgi:hypothetical protein